MNELKQTLLNLSYNDFKNNQAANLLFQDYINFHWVRLIISTLLLLIFIYLTIFFFKREKNTSLEFIFKKKVYKVYKFFCILISLCLLLVAFANLHTVIKPLPGFKLFLEEVSKSKGTNNSEIVISFNSWLNNASAKFPSILENKMHMISYQHGFSTILFFSLGCLILIFSIWLWKFLINKVDLMYNTNQKFSFKNKFIIFISSSIAFALVLCSLLFIVLAEVNLRWTISPTSAFLYYL